MCLPPGLVVTITETISAEPRQYERDFAFR
jgi:hypothetical protein